MANGELQLSEAASCEGAPAMQASPAQPTTDSPNDELLGASNAMISFKQLLERVAMTPSTVLLQGESGVGKDAAARYIHARSNRAAGSFVNVTCSAMPEALLESELFGHERGAFTDAKSRKFGLLEVADGGTVLLDEIAEMSPVLQAKLLRALEEKAFRRVGGSVDLHPDVRVIAATNRDLRAEVCSGRFRDDLYYRLAVLRVQVPSLRQRGGDVLLLARHFLRRYSNAFGKNVRDLAPGAQAALCAHTWPGNVRELKNAMERAVLLADGALIEAKDLALEECHVAVCGPGEHLLQLPLHGIKLEELEQDLVVQALERTNGNRTRAAALLGLTRDQIRHRIEKYGLEEVRLVHNE